MVIKSYGSPKLRIFSGLNKKIFNSLFIQPHHKIREGPPFPDGPSLFLRFFCLKSLVYFTIDKRCVDIPPSVWIIIVYTPLASSVVLIVNV